MLVLKTGKMFNFSERDLQACKSKTFKKNLYRILIEE
jgi:hypothetical protein